MAKLYLNKWILSVKLVFIALWTVASPSPVDSLNWSLDSAIHNKLPLLEVDTRLALSKHFGNTGDYSAALSEMQAADSLFLNRSLWSREAAVAIGWCLVHYRTHEFEKAIEAIDEGLKSQRLSEEDRARLNMNGIACSRRIKKFKQALGFGREALRSSFDNNSYWIKGNIYHNIATVYAEVDSLDSAMAYHQKAIEIRTQIADHKGLAHSYNNLGHLSEKMNDRWAAISWFHKALHTAKEAGLANTIRISQRNISLNYLKLNKGDEGVGHFMEYLQFQDSLYGSDKAAEIAQLQEDYEKKQREWDIRRMELELAASKAREESANFRFYVILALMIVLVLAGLALWLNRNYRAVIKQSQSMYLEIERLRSSFRAKDEQLAMALDGPLVPQETIEVLTESFILKWGKPPRREMEALYHLSQGLTRSEAAEIMMVHASTIGTYHRNLKARFGVTRLPDLIILSSEHKEELAFLFQNRETLYEGR